MIRTRDNLGGVPTNLHFIPLCLIVIRPAQIPVYPVLYLYIKNGTTKNVWIQGLKTRFF
jgi:hypothetical protein